MGGRRVGFGIETLSGERAVLAHVDLPGPHRVGRYGVDVAAFERLALPAMDGKGGEVVIVDEIGKMELASDRFRTAVSELLEARDPIVATVHVFRHPFTDALKERVGVELVSVTAKNRDALPQELAERLQTPRSRRRGDGCGEDG